MALGPKSLVDTQVHFYDSGLHALKPFDQLKMLRPTASNTLPHRPPHSIARKDQGVSAGGLLGGKLRRDGLLSTVAVAVCSEHQGLRINSKETVVSGDSCTE